MLSVGHGGKPITHDYSAITSSSFTVYDARTNGVFVQKCGVRTYVIAMS
jgi:hypothetical protein